MVDRRLLKDRIRRSVDRRGTSGPGAIAGTSRRRGHRGLDDRGEECQQFLERGEPRAPSGREMLHPPGEPAASRPTPCAEVHHEGPVHRERRSVFASGCHVCVSPLLASSFAIARHVPQDVPWPPIGSPGRTQGLVRLNPGNRQGEARERFQDVSVRRFAGGLFVRPRRR